MTPIDPVGSFLVEILHSVEGGDVEPGVLEPRNNSLVFAIALSLSLTCIYILHTYIAFIFICLIYLVQYCYMLGIVCSHLYLTKRAIVGHQLLI